MEYTLSRTSCASVMERISGDRENPRNPGRCGDQMTMRLRGVGRNVSKDFSRYGRT
ncbi:hypothetical protein M413DRAFT_448018 [Hebeloma cylindrosporum]|uniref:Uncharacterized protein n=1 Tax=Hebeloma cylindrosporum TaxID=76867 RepID=A0A0C2XKJ6_HEBCY|nr:hypothetical protein M413DRAFT_448018 [Hebeloma cylindrosporum h7]